MRKSLNGKWILDSKKINKSLEVFVPGSIYNDLFVNKIIDDPYYRDNEMKMLDYMKEDYSYTKTFNISTSEIKKEIRLNFLGLDTITEIFLNDNLILKTYNMHRRYEVDVKEYVIVGENKLRIIIKSCLDFIKKEEKKCPCELMQMSYAVKGYNHIRKAHSMFGWDWGPQMPDGGIWRDIYLDIFDKARFKNVEIRQQTEKNHSKIKVVVQNDIIRETSIKLELFYINELIYSEDKNASSLNEFFIEINNPKLWYPIGYGAQNLYTLSITLNNKNKIVDKYEEKIGLRKLEIIREKDKYGTSFMVLVNNQKIFLKGVDYIIEDNIFPRSNNKRTFYLLNAAKDANCNCIRIWGGGIYPNNYFYQLCDELGFLVWQDLMFACGYYNMENKDFVDEIRLEIIDNVKRFRNHPSLMLICGNNENETAALNWNIPSKEYTMKWYLYQYEEFIPNILKEYAPDTFYWPSSPSSGGKFDDPNDDSRGDMHYWGVWHNNEPIEYYRKYFPRVMSEFGMQSFPTIKTINAFTRPEDRNIFSFVMERHQKNTSANQKIMNYIGSMFKFPNSFKSLIYISQLIQAEAVRYCVEHLRRNYGRCMGSIYWQLNDCWPVASWSSIDYYGRYKALQYYTKRFYNPFIVSIEEDMEKSKAKIVITNETSHEEKGKYYWQLIDFKGLIKKSGFNEYCITPYSTLVIENLEFNLSFEEKRNCVLIVDVIDNMNNIFTNSINFTRDKYLELEKPDIKLSLEEKDNEYILTLNSNVYTKYVEVEIIDKDIIFSDNYFHLFPNRNKVITFKCNKKINVEKIKTKNLTDSY